MTLKNTTPDADSDTAQMLKDILDMSYAIPGATVIAVVPHGGTTVKQTHTLVTPEPRMDRVDQRCFAGDYIHVLSAALCSAATAMVSPRTCRDAGWSIAEDDFVTVVFRGGDPVVSGYEMQFHHGRRFSNHGTNAFDGEIFAVTPSGWCSLYEQDSGESPSVRVNDWTEQW